MWSMERSDSITGAIRWRMQANLKIYAPGMEQDHSDASVKPENSKVKIWVHGSNEIALSKEID